jgi:hypothetical protein
MIRRPASLHAVPRCVSGFPRFSGTIRALRLPAARPASLRFLRLAVPSMRSPFRSHRPANARPAGPGLLGSASPCRGGLRRRRQDLPSSWGTPIAPSPGSSTPAGPSAPDRTATPWHGPRGGNVKGSCIAAFEAQSPGFGARCLRFAPAIARQGRQTRFRLLVRLCRAGFHPQGSDERFQSVSLHLILLSQACLAQFRTRGSGRGWRGGRSRRSGRGFDAPGGGPSSSCSAGPPMRPGGRR